MYFLLLAIIAFLYFSGTSYYRLTNSTDMSFAPGVRSIGMINSGMTNI
jgi:hypothetical protein